MNKPSHDISSLIRDIYKHRHENLQKEDLVRLKRGFARKHQLKDIPSNIQLIACYQQMVKDGELDSDENVERLLMKRPVRSESGIVSVQVLTKPFRCPGECIFCPNDFTMPKSYINTEPGAMRALLNNFDPIKQTYNRLLSLTMTGHKTDKIEMIVLGGTWDVYPEDYKESFVKGLYDACNTFPEFYKHVHLNTGEKKALNYTIQDYHIQYPGSLDESIHTNETGPCRIIGLTIETRPEYVNDVNCRFWRKLGVTRIEMGVQSTNDEVLKANKRGHNHEASRQAMHKLRQYGFKVSIHLMPGLYQSNYEKDLQTFQDIYRDPAMKPDEIKFYPTSVIPNTELYELYKSGKYKPLEKEIIMKLIKDVFQNIIPPYTRIKRLVRDIPATEIIAGSNITNLSQLTRKEIRENIIGNKQAQALYQRLYKNAHIYDDINQYLDSIPTNGGHKKRNETDQVKNSTNIETSIIGVAPDEKGYRNFVALDTRSREIKHKFTQYKGMPSVEEGKEKRKDIMNIVIRKYYSSVGREYFISFEDRLGYIYGFTRLLLPDEHETVSRESLGPTTALVRELHVYGTMASLGNTSILGEKKKMQHKGIGTQLMDLAESISRKRGYTTLTVISGVGVRGFYQKIGFSLQGSYMSKFLTK